MKNKFRVWDNLNKRWLKDVSSTHGEIRYAVSDDQVFKMDYNADLGKTEWTLIGDTTVQQFTGRLDYKDKEVYEGDIVQFVYKIPDFQNEITEIDKKLCGATLIGKVVIWVDNFMYPCIIVENEYYGKMFFGIEEIGFGEVIGNIFESGDLLNEK